jgi:lipoprotein-releasing system permease protein
MFYESFIARRYLRSGSRDGFLSAVGLISVAGVALGVTAIIIVLSVMNGFEWEVRDRIVGTNAHVIVLRHDEGMISDYRDLMGTIGEVPHVTGVSPFVFTKVMLSTESETDGAVLRGIDPEVEGSVTRIIENVSPADFSLEGRDGLPGIVLGVELAFRLRVGVGEEISVTSPLAMVETPFGAMPRVRKFVVVGTFDSGMYQYDGTLVFVSIPAAQDLLSAGDEVTGIEVALDDLFLAGELDDRILDRLERYTYTTVNWMELNRNLFTWMKMEKIVMFVILLLIVIVAGFNIAGTLTLIVMQKTRDIGILKSMGATSAGVMRIFIREGLLIGMLGTSIGVITGVVLSWVLDRYEIISLPGDIYFLETLPVRMEPLWIAGVVVSAIAVSFLATVYPSWRASRLVPVEAIRYEQ